MKNIPPPYVGGDEGSGSRGRSPNLRFYWSRGGRRGGAFVGEFCRIVVQISAEPAFDLLEGHAFAQVVIEQLVAAKFADGEIF